MFLYENLENTAGSNLKEFFTLTHKWKWQTCRFFFQKIGKQTENTELYFIMESTK